MKKMLLILLLLPLLFPHRDPVGLTAEEAGLDQAEAELTEEERAVSGRLRLDGSYDASGALSRLWARIRGSLAETLRQELGFAGKLLLIALACSLASALSPGSRPPPWLEIGACCAAALLLAGSMDGVLRQAEETLNRLHDYAAAAFPAFFTTLAACGVPAAASVRYAAVRLSSELFMNLSRNCILPFVHAYLSVSVCAALFDNPMLRSAARLAKWCAVTAMSLLTSAFCAYIGLSGIVSGSADAASVRAAKTVLSATLPVVGGILSNSASSLMAAAQVIKNSAGIFCLVAVCAICAAPFAMLAVKLLVYKAAAALSSLAGSERYARLLSDMGTGFAMLLGLVGSFGVILFFSFLSGIRAVGAV